STASPPLDRQLDVVGRDVGGDAGSTGGGPPRMGMSVQHLKNMTALRMAQQGQGVGSSGSSQSTGQARRANIHGQGHGHLKQQHQHQGSPPQHPSPASIPTYPPQGRPQQIRQQSFSQAKPQSEAVVVLAPPQPPPPRHLHQRQHSAPRLFPTSEDASMKGGNRLPHGLSVEELKEMTKMRLQSQGRQPSEPAGAGGGG
ncbi:unnamed protein product, partial [Discosporangium mesarthrocarpum]